MPRKKKLPTKRQLIARWTHLVRVLNGLSWHERRKHFDMGAWGYKNDCGTVACAAGHCGLDPWFQQRGLKLRFSKVREEDRGDVYHETTHIGRLSMGAEDFFGATGTNDILTNTTYRPVSTVIAEAKQHISWLKKNFDQEAEFPWYFF